MTTEIMRQSLEMQHINDELRAKNKELKHELKAALDANHLVNLRLDNAKAYLTGSHAAEARISAALTQIMQAQEGR